MLIRHGDVVPFGPQGHGPPDGQGGLWNEFAHNITVGAGQRVTVCPSRSFEWDGTWCIEHIPTQDQDGNWQDLPANGYRQAQCFEVGSVPPAPDDGITLCDNEGKNPPGTRGTFTSDDPNLDDAYDDMATSIMVRGPFMAEVYEHPNYKGTTETFNHDDYDLRDNRIGNDTISSLRVYPAVALYKHTNYNMDPDDARCETFVSDDSNLVGTWIGNDTVSSIKVPSGYIATLYEHPNFAAEGRKEHFFDNDRDLRDNVVVYRVLHSPRGHKDTKIIERLA